MGENGQEKTQSNKVRKRRGGENKNILLFEGPDRESKRSQTTEEETGGVNGERAG